MPTFGQNADELNIIHSEGRKSTGSEDEESQANGFSKRNHNSRSMVADTREIFTGKTSRPLNESTDA